MSTRTDVARRVAEGVAQAARAAVAASLPVELQARLAGTPQPTSGQVCEPRGSTSILCHCIRSTHLCIVNAAAGVPHRDYKTVQVQLLFPFWLPFAS